MKYYLAGPMTGLPEHNYPAFEEAAKNLRADGLNVLSPREIDHGETEETRGKYPYHVYLKAGIKLLLECDGIIMMEGWADSKGAMFELQVAAACGMEVVLYFRDEQSFVRIS